MSDDRNQERGDNSLEVTILRQAEQHATTTTDRIKDAMVEARGKRDEAELRTRATRPKTSILYR